MFISQNKKQIGLSNPINIPGINVSTLQSILTLHKVKRVKRSLSVYKIRDFNYIHMNDID